MAIHPLNRQHQRDTTAAGISDGAVTATDTATGTTFAVATNVASATGLLPTGSAAFSTPSIPAPATTSTSSTSSSPSPTSSSSSSSSDSGISIGTVIGACVGALAGALILILLGLWLYRRSDPIKKRRPTRAQRDMSQQNWNKLGDDEDKWEGMQKPKEGGEVAPMEKLEMFKKSTPSVYTMKTTTSELPPLNFDSHPFAQYHPNLAKELASTEESPVPQFANKTESAAISWDGDNAGGSSYLSIRSNRLSGAMSPSLDMAIPTPALTSSEPHIWESAEVLNLEGQTAEIVDSKNPFINPIERRKSEHNPFFGASVPIRTTQPSPKVNKGKSREITPPAPVVTNNPFITDATYDEPLDKTPTRPTFSHSVMSSVSSVSSNDRAMQSLIAALDTTPEEIQARLKVAEPSLISHDAADSIYTTADYSSEEEDDAEEEDVTESFPLPPGSSHSGN
ncbi:hypothetical protein BT96DRAFT_914429 [Gymnopus androsaceus JB14]|uniref:Uncharacterized protein n=1 Tax=Gymnopus androsaceus JB14 TaxID=1447944 RepID=A0A6A4IB27_9AGAR|nr:hypothetical protein BT96DRAFT_914429 [Gymnopus androsaceus JB14]